MIDKGMKKMSTVEAVIEKTINSPAKTYTVTEAQKILQSCGILDTKNRVKEAYRDIVVKAEPRSDGSN